MIWHLHAKKLLARQNKNRRVLFNWTYYKFVFFISSMVVIFSCIEIEATDEIILIR